MLRFLFLCSLLLLVLTACQKEEVIQNSDYIFVKPSHFPEPTYSFDNNPVTEAGFELGKQLFNDPRLSRDNSVACSNCHVKAIAFADPQHRLSVGIDNRVGKRNSPPIQNLAFRETFFWDGGVAHLDFVPPNAIENPVEMDDQLSTVVQKLNQRDSYIQAFRAAFGEIDSINTPLLLHALSQYMNMLISADSPYDQYVTGKGTLSDDALAGQLLFKQKCATCHKGVLFTNQDFANNGLDSVFKDLGRSLISEWSGDDGKFKVPSLRNVELTRPYMHDGRFETLAEVLAHYNSGVKASATLAPQLQQDGKLGIPMTQEEQDLIIEFLYTLTDRNFVSNPLF
ncbi:MAG: cytochrome c peroxidase [Bacteroidota bacterium]